MSSKINLYSLRQNFRKGGRITVDELFAFYLQHEPQLLRSTFRWRLHELKRNGVLKSVGRGIYMLGREKEKFQPLISKTLKIIFNKLKKAFPYTTFCIWTTQWLHGLMLHQPNKHFVLIEAEPDSMSAIFEYLKANSSKFSSSSFLDPSPDEIDHYVSSKIESFIVKPLISQAPLSNQESVIIPTLEKILVDLYADKALFYAYQGTEMVQIFKNTSDQYDINISSMFRYAARRNKVAELRDFIINTAQLGNL